MRLRRREKWKEEEEKEGLKTRHDNKNKTKLEVLIKKCILILNNLISKLTFLYLNGIFPALKYSRSIFF